jgi:prevent-host-death family protein
MMKTMGAAKFKAHCLAVMDEVQAKREPVLVTKNGRPVAKVVPVEDETDPLAIFRTESFWAVGDLTEPMVEAEGWEAAR